MIYETLLWTHSSDGDNVSKGMCENADGSEDDSTQYDEYDKTSILPFHVNTALNENRPIRTAAKNDTVSTAFWSLCDIFKEIIMYFEMLYIIIISSLTIEPCVLAQQLIFSSQLVPHFLI